MPISSGVNQDKINTFGVHGKPVSNVDHKVACKPNNTKKLLSVTPALPLLPAVPRPPRLHQRSNTTLNESVRPAQGDVDSKERNATSDRITLDRRGLTALPLLVGEAHVKLLSLQHNLITRLDNIPSLGLTRLVFLDVYDNQLDKIAGLDTLQNLRVLLMGKNRIRRMEGLKCLQKLEVLDLHGNQITQVSGLSNLAELKVLNLAGNQIRILGTYDLQGLKSLQELNLRRNRLKKLLGFGETPQLLKLFLNNNEIQSIEDMNSIAKARHIKEVSMDGNPVAVVGDCVSFLVSYLPELQLLSQIQITDKLRKAAMTWRQSKESTNTDFSNLCNVEGEDKRDEVIYNARTNWELLRSQTTKSLALTVVKPNLLLKDIKKNEIPSPNMQEESPLLAKAVIIPERVEAKRVDFSKRRTTSQAQEFPNTISTPQVDSVEFFRLPPILAPLIQGEDEAGESVSSVEHIGECSLSSVASESSSDSEVKQLDRGSRSASVTNRKHVHTQRVQTAKSKVKTASNPSKVREQGGDYLVEISGRYLNVYGQGALRFIDRPWNPIKAGDVTHVRFNYVNFNSLSCVLGRLKQRFCNAEHFSFRETNINCLGQLNALADIQGLTSLMIHPEGNPITNKAWKSYAVYRLSHWGLRIINDEEVSVECVTDATEEFQGLSDLVLLSLPDSLLQPLLSRLRLETSQQSARQWLWNADSALRTVVAKEALQWRKTTLSQEDLVWRHKGRQHLSFLLEQTCGAITKLKMLEAHWPTILKELVRDTLVDYSHLDNYMKECMSKLKP
uniref:Dynein axonemal assembly factor 1 homolog n=1 Tax=Clastoptera arizonana TaxID=38151 RepID=A0A1B6CMV2_9HEMI